MTVLIFANGEIKTTDWIRPYLNEAQAVLAADGGTRYVLSLDRQPSVVIGDMDSIAPPLRETLAASGTRFVSHPAAKDETDLELALLYAVAHYEAEIIVFGATGGRLDQTLANILLLAHPGLRGHQVVLREEHQRIWLLDARFNSEDVAAANRAGDGVTPGVVGEIDGQTGDTVSLIPVGGAAHVAATSGLRWPLNDELLAFGQARGVSNVMEAPQATIHLQTGALLCVHTWHGWGR